MKSSDSPQDPSADKIATTAVEWLLEQKEGFAPGRAEIFQAWCAADARHELAVAKAARTMELLAGLPDLAGPLTTRLDEDQIAERRGARSRWRRAAAWSVAAAAAVALTVWWRWPAADDNVRYVSNTALPQQVVLDDGSFVDLNTNTTLRTQLLPQERRITLREGEAHFAVAHDASRPFIVEAGGISVRAVGTAFNVRLNAKTVEVLVFEGRVEISTPAPRGTGPIEREPPPQLGVAVRATYSRVAPAAGLVLTKADPQEMHAARSWHSAFTTISNRPLREIVELFNRRNPVHLVLADPELGDRTLGGSFPIGQPQAFVRLLELDGDVRSEPRGENEIVLRLKR